MIQKKKLLKLKSDLKKAVSLEQYEKAATIRDMIKDMEKQPDQDKNKENKGED